MGLAVGPQLLSVVIPTRNRAPLLRLSLESLTAQTLPRQQLEVVIVDDGSTDDTPAVCREFAQRLPLRYFRIRPSGISAAKNLGVFVSMGSIVLFFDDDDVADPDLCRQHLEAHDGLPTTTAVLGFTGWAPSLRITPVMDYVMSKGFLLFSYAHLTDGHMLDFTYFWGGRSSCKRLFLVTRGVFNQHFPRIIEDIELGYRLSRFGLEVKFHAAAKQYMNRAIRFDDFCGRCEAQGQAFWAFSQLHADPVVQAYCDVVDLAVRWADTRPRLPAVVRRVHALEAAWERARGDARRAELVQELDPLYGEAFRGFRLKGTAAAAAGAKQHKAPKRAPARRLVTQSVRSTRNVASA